MLNFSKKFGQQLLDNFCAHPKRKHIALRNFKDLPPQLGQALFGDGFPIKLDLSLIERVFPNALKLTLNHIDKKVLITEREQFVRDVMTLIAEKTQLIEVTIQSAPNDRIQESVPSR